MTAIPQVVAARVGTTQQVNYYRKTINFNDALISAPANPFGRLPLNAFIVDVQVEIVTAFNAATTNVLTIGTTTASANEIVSGVDVDEAGLADTDVSRARGTILTRTSELNLYYKYTQTGTAATAGKANVIVTYIPDNDG